jgi:tetratricopeptide (TPR) repeat protein
MTERRTLVAAVLVVFAVALALRLGHLAGLESGLAGSHLFAMARGDAAHHWDEARQILDGDPELRQRIPWKGPGYSYFLAALMALFGRSAGTLRWVVAVLGALNCAALVLLARRVLGPGGSCLAGLAAAANGALIFFDGELFFPTLLVSLNLPVLWLLGRESAGWKAHGAAGVLLGLSALVHPVYLVPAAALAAWSARRAWSHGGALALAAALTIFPGFLTNLIVRGQAVPISWNGGINVYVGNQPAFDQYSGNRTSAWARILQTPVDAGIESESARDRLYYRLAARQAAGAPLEALGLLLRKAVILLQGPEYASNVGIYELREFSPVLAAALWRAGPLWFPFGLWGPLAIAGAALLALRPRAPASGALAVWSLGVAATIVASFNTSRYRAPLVFFGCIWVAHALVEARRGWIAGRRRAVAAGAVAVLVLAALLAAGAVPQRGHPLPLEWNEAALLTSRGAHGEAEAWIERALERAPEDPQLRHAVAGFYAERGDREREREHLQRMLALEDLEPDYVSVGHRLLARSYAAEGRFEDARRHIRAAVDAGVDSTSWRGRPYYRLGLGPVTACWLRLEEARIELAAGEPARAAELVRRVRADCKSAGRVEDELRELDAQLVLAGPRLAPAPRPVATPGRAG